MANSVLPQPVPPHISVGRPRGRPPPVIASRPWMPVGHFASVGSFSAGPGPTLIVIESFQLKRKTVNIKKNVPLTLYDCRQNRVIAECFAATLMDVFVRYAM
jgi:hypothetical protein